MEMEPSENPKESENDEEDEEEDEEEEEGIEEAKAGNLFAKLMSREEGDENLFDMEEIEEISQGENSKIAEEARKFKELILKGKSLESQAKAFASQFQGYSYTSNFPFFGQNQPQVPVSNLPVKADKVHKSIRVLIT
jgi:hypothetical protein